MTEANLSEIEPDLSKQEDSGQGNIFAQDDRKGLYHAILSRRDVRGQFVSDPIPDEVLARVLVAAHWAPSVGFMQPWSFILVQDRAVRRQIKDAFEKANAEAAMMFEGAKQEQYRALKLEGILDAPLNLCITCDKNRAGPVVLGRTHIPVMDVYSTVCAVENLWLAARAEGLGVGWVSIMEEDMLRSVLQIPEHVVPVAYLCLGKVSHFLDKPELGIKGWRQRLAIEELVCQDSLTGGPALSPSFIEALKAAQKAAEHGTLGDGCDDDGQGGAEVL